MGQNLLQQDVLANATSHMLSAKNPDINIIANLWSNMSKTINGMNPLPQIAAEFRAAVHNEWQNITQTSVRLLMVGVQRGPHGIAEVFRWICRLSTGNCVGSSSYHCLRVTFVLRLVHSLYGMVHVKQKLCWKVILKITMHLKIDLQNCNNIFSSQYMETMVTYDSLTKD